MSVTETIIMSSIYLLFPISIYFVYMAYIRSISLKEITILLDYLLVLSVIALISIKTKYTFYILIFAAIPLIISYYKDHTSNALLISALLIYVYSYVYKINYITVILEYIICLIIHKLIKNKKIKVIILLLNSIVFNIIMILLYRKIKIIQILIYIFFPTIIFIIYLSLILYLLNKGNEILNLNEIIKETKKDQALYNMLSKLTHEIKNPIAVCKGYLEMLDLNDETKVKKYIPIIENEINRSLEVICDFSSLSKIKKLDLEIADFYLIIEEIVETLNPLFKANKSTLIFIKDMEELYINLDYSKIKQVLINIIKNSLEAKKPDEILEVKIIAKKCKRNVKLTIKDNGIGMNKETLSHIYNAFYTTKENGSGLGVVLSKEIIDLHKGEINYNSSLNKGTTVTIKVPI